MIKHVACIRDVMRRVKEVWDRGFLLCLKVLKKDQEHERLAFRMKDTILLIS